MSAHDLESWMWAEAIRRLDRAERLQRQFFRPPAGGPRPRRQWEPPVDVFETADTVWVTVALPGVPAEQLTGLEVRDDLLIVTGERRVPAPDARAVLHRLEIPHGQFERRVTLPYPRLAIVRHELADGCLYLQLRKR